MQMPPPPLHKRSPVAYHHRSRPSSSQPLSKTHSRSNSISRTHSRDRPYYYREQYRPRSHSQSSSRPHATRSYTLVPPNPSRAYSYALNQPPPPPPILLPQPVPHLHPAPRRSRTLPNQPHNVVYHRYDAPRGGPTYVIGTPAVGGIPPQIRMQS